MVQPQGSLQKIASCPTKPRGGKCFILYSGTRKEFSLPNEQSTLPKKAGNCCGAHCPERIHDTGAMNERRSITRGKVCTGCC